MRTPGLEDCYMDRINEWLTLYRRFTVDTIVGWQAAGMRKILVLADLSNEAQKIAIRDLAVFIQRAMW